MKNNHISLFFLLFLFTILNFCNTSSKKKSNHSTINNEVNNKFRKRNKINIFSKRKLENFDSPVKKLEESSFVQLKILIDKEELFRTCPYGDTYANNIYIAMQNARNTLQSSIKIEVDPSIVVRINSEDQNTIKKEYGIEKYSSFFNNNFNLIDNENFFIFGKFISGLTVDSTSYLLEKYGGSPCFGIIYFNENIDKSKLTDEYLTPLMLHHFIRLLGFNGEIIPNPTLTKVDYPKVQSPDILVAMSNEALIKYIVDLKDNGTLIVDPGTTDVEDVKDYIEEHNIKVYEAPATKTATDEIGLKIVANIVMVGAITKITGVISKEAAIKAIEASVPAGTEEKNISAFEAGYALAE